MLPSSQLRDITIKDYIVIFKRRMWVIFACVVIISTWTSLKAFKKVRLYQAFAKVLIERNTPDLGVSFQPQRSYMFDKDYFQSQIAIIKSRTMSQKAVEVLTTLGDNSLANLKEPDRSFSGGISISTQQTGNIINIGYISTDPVKAAKYANALTNAFLQQDLAKRMEVTQLATGWLSSQLVELRNKLSVSEIALNKYIKDNQIISVTDIERNTQGSIERLRQDKLTIENELGELSKRYKPKHPKMVALNTRLETVNRSIDAESKKLMELNEKMIQYNVLKREVQSNKSLYESLLRRFKETEVDKELRLTNIRVIDWADVPRAPFSPNRKRDITTGIMFSVMWGVGLALLLEYLDSTVKTAEDIEMYVRLPFLGYIPTARSEAKLSKDIDLASDKTPHSRIAESYRSIRTSIIFSAPEDRPLKTILITSASPQEGKTTVSCNLGITFAHSNEKTLLIEADMRKPRLDKSLGLENKMGLSSFLTGATNLDDSIQPTFIPNLFVMLSGPKPPNPAELLTSKKPRVMLEELKTKFDRIIIDSTPALTVTDTVILANMVDGVIDVVRASFLNIELILRGRQRLYEAKSRIIGVILNNVNVKKEDSYYYYHYYYSEDKEKKTI
ncbi:polysaccharide biosynthesis tyrosine autokinase [bacterium]|nr:MAG: polysaccharide biosynthesis tyrosine autokinase [bacterium]